MAAALAPLCCWSAERVGDHRRMAVSEEEFRRRVEPDRAELLAHCYRMLGSVQDAEDALQEALLRAWRALPRLQSQGALRS